MLGLRGLRIEARAKEVMGAARAPGGDLGELREDFRLVGKHLGNAQQAYAAADRRLERLEQRSSPTIAGDEDRDEQPEPAQALLLARPTGFDAA